MKWNIINVVERRTSMNSLKRIAVAASLIAVFSILLPAAKAVDRSWNWPGDANWTTMAYFEESVQIGNLVLAPGTYLIQRNPSIYSSRVAMIYNVDQARWEGIVIGEAAHRPSNQLDPVLLVEKQGDGQPDVVRSLFYQSWSDGIAFRYSNVKTTSMASKHGKAITTIASSAK
jgi:hypothetical protein